MKLKDKVAIITGAGRNIGEAVSHTLAREGAKVAVVDLEKDRAEKVAADISAAGNTAKAFVADVSDEAQVQKLIKDVVAAFGRVDILLNNVAISDNQHILDISKEDWDKVLAVTLTVPFLMGKYAAKQMVAQGDGGNILNVASTSGCLYFGQRRRDQSDALHGGAIGAPQNPGEFHFAKQNWLASGEG
jgi:NAD(P)-dependent dehydrogenase (short-subunit alcohol dehydrogenase family)